MILYFKNCRGKVRKIGKVDGRMTPEKIRAEVDRQIKAFCDERSFTIYYTRVWNEELNGKMMTKFDVGSHTEFFYVYPECWDKYRQTVKTEQVI